MKYNRPILMAEEDNKYQNRDLNIDLIKIIAMFSVVLLHTSVSFVNLDNYIVADIMKTWGLTAVPLFFMVTGYLTLGRKNIDFKYSAHKIFSIIRFIFCFAFIYWFAFAMKKMDFDFLALISGTFGSLVNQGYFPWFWYFGAIIIIYGLLPIINGLYVKSLIGGGNWLIITLLAVQFIIFVYAVNVHMDKMGINITFKLYNWLTFYCVGGALNKHSFSSNWVLLCFLFVMNYAFQMFESKYLPQTEFYYSSLPLLLLVVIIFTSLKSIKITDSKIIKELSKLFLLVYSIHLIIMRYIQNDIFGNSVFSPLLYFIVISIITITISYIITKIPYLNKILSL